MKRWVVLVIVLVVLTVVLSGCVAAPAGGEKLADSATQELVSEALKAAYDRIDYDGLLTNNLYELASR